MKKLVLTILILTPFALVGWGFASTTPLPTKFNHVDALEIEVCERKLEAWQKIINEISAAAKPVVEKKNAILKTYKIDPEQVGRTVGYNLETGEIKREPALPTKAQVKK